MHGIGCRLMEKGAKPDPTSRWPHCPAGAGFAGLAAANTLASKGIPVTVYDMGTRGPGASAHPLTYLCCPSSPQQPPSCSWLGRQECPASHAAWPCAAHRHAQQMAIIELPGPAAGGRASSREVSLSALDYLQFDHGCQFITASTPVALEQILDWERRGE